MSQVRVLGEKLSRCYGGCYETNNYVNVLYKVKLQDPSEEGQDSTRWVVTHNLLLLLLTIMLLPQ